MSTPPSATPDSHDDPPRRRGRAGRILLWTALAVAVLLIAVRAVLTTVIVRTAVDQAPSYIHGRLEVDDLDVQLLQGGALLEGVRLFVDGDPDPSPAVAFESLRIRLDLWELLSGRVELEEARLVSPDVRLDRNAEGALLLANLVRESEAPAEETEPPAEEQGEPTEVVFEQVRIEGGRIRYEGLDFELDLDAGGWTLAGDRAADATLELRFSGEAGDEGRTISLDLDATLAEQRGALALRWSDLDVKTIAEAVSEEFASALRSATTEGELTLALEAGEGTHRVLRGEGRIALVDVDVELDAPTDVAAKWKRLDVPIASFELPLAADDEGALGLGSRVVVRLGDVVLASPAVELVRRASEAAPDASDEAAADEGDPVELDLAVAGLSLADGSVRFVDETVEPKVDFPLSGLGVSASDFTLEPLTVASFRVEAETLGDEPIEVEGALSPAKTSIEADASKISMLPFDGYLRDMADVSVGGGSVSVESRVEVEPERYRAPTELVFHDLSMSGVGQGTTFQKTFGMPVGLAVALLRDYKGEIVLDLPIEGSKDGGGISWASVFTNAMRGTLTAALASPLKALGMVSNVVLGPGNLLEQRIPFEPGQAQLSEAGQERLDALVSLLASRPALGIGIEGRVSEADLPEVGAADGDQGVTEAGEPPDAPTDLAEARAEAVLAYLAERVDGIAERAEVEKGSAELAEDGPAAVISLQASRF